MLGQKYWIQEECTSKIILNPNNFGSQKFGSNKTILTPKKWGPKSLVEIGSDIVDMDKCHQDKCCMDKCHPDIWHIVRWPQKPTFKVWSKLGN